MSDDIKRYYKSNKKVWNAFNEQVLLVLCSQVAYDQYRYDLFNNASLANPRTLINPYLNDGYYIVDCIKDEFTGYDAFIVRHEKTGTDCIVNVGSELVHSDYLAHADWQNNMRVAQNKVNTQYEKALNYFYEVKDKYNIVAITGNSLGGGNTMYTAMHCADIYPHIHFFTLNPSGIPSSMIIEKDLIGDNVKNIINDSEILLGLQSAGGNYQTHLKYLGNTIIADIGIKNFDAYYVNHRGSEEWLDKTSFEDFINNRMFPATSELACFDLCSGELITPYLNNNSKVYKKRSDLIFNYKTDMKNILNIQKEQYLKIENELQSNTTTSFAFMSELNTYLSKYLNFYHELDPKQKAVFNIYDIYSKSNFPLLKSIQIKEVSSSAKEYVVEKIPNAVNKFIQDLEAIIKLNLPTEKCDELRSNLLNDTRLLFANLDLLSPLYHEMIHHYEVDKTFRFFRNSKFKLNTIQLNTIDESKYLILKNVVKLLNQSMDENIENISKIITEFEEDHKEVIVNLINSTYNNDEKIANLLQKIDNLYLSEHKYFNSQEEAELYKQTGLFNTQKFTKHLSFNGVDKPKVYYDESTINKTKKELIRKQQEVINIADIANIVNQLEIGKYFKEVMSYFKDTLIDALISEALDTNTLARLSIINKTNEASIILTKNLYKYVSVDNNIRKQQEYLNILQTKYLEEINKIMLFKTNV